MDLQLCTRTFLRLSDGRVLRIYIPRDQVLICNSRRMGHGNIAVRNPGEDGGWRLQTLKSEQPGHRIVRSPLLLWSSFPVTIDVIGVVHYQGLF